jgi:hypothetical protein
MHDPQGAHRFNDQIIELIRVRATADPRDRFRPVNRDSLGVLLDEAVVPRFLDFLRDFRERLVPRNILPLRAPRPPNLRLQQPAIIEDVLFERCALGAQRPPVGGVVGITFDVHHLRRNVLRLVSDGIDDRAATHCAVRTSRPSFTGAGDFQDSELCVSGLEIETENCGGDSAYRGELQKVSAGSLHRTPWDRDKQTADSAP